jgi:hypothetical protein
MNRFLLALVLSLGMVVGPSSVVQAQDGQLTSIASAGMGVAMIGIAGADIGRSATNCSLFAAAAATNPDKSDDAAQKAKDKGDSATSGGCGQLALNALAVAGGILSVVSSLMSLGAQKGGGSSTGGGPGYLTANPTDPLIKQLGCIDLANCGCGPNEAATNPMCSPDGLDKIKADLENAKSLFATGDIPLPEGKTPEGMLGELDNALAELGKAESALATGDLGDILATDGLGNGRSGGAGKKGAGGGGGDGMGGGAYGGFGGGGAVRAGPADRSGLGSALSVNELNMIDEATGKKLTIWQRATRRYQGEGSRRALMMSRAEFIRKEAGLRVAQGEKLRLEAERRAQARENSKKSQKKPASLGKKH